MVYDIVIIGAGPAGMNAAIYANRAGAKVLLLEKGAPGGQMVTTAEVENYIGFDTVDGAELSLKMFDHTMSFGVEYEYGDVERIEDGNIKKIHTADQVFEAKAVVIATGMNAKSLGAENEERFLSNGISWCAICDGNFYKGRNVVVVGGGNSAIEESIYLAGIVNHVTVLARNTLRASKAYIDRAMSKPNIEIIKKRSIVRWLGDTKMQGAVVRNNDTGETEEMTFDGAFLFIGWNPNTDPFKDLGIVGDDGFIIANEKMETSIPGVFACGDVIQKDIRQIATAIGDATIAGLNAQKYVEHWEE
jgi:thioredoxin reductase (NADPH)